MPKEAYFGVASSAPLHSYIILLFDFLTLEFVRNVRKIFRIKLWGLLYCAIYDGSIIMIYVLFSLTLNII